MSFKTYIPSLLTIVGTAVLLINLSGTRVARADSDTVTEIHYSFGNTSDSVWFNWDGQEQDIYYGLTTAYGQMAVAGKPAVIPVDSSGPFRQVELSGLQASTTYHYRIGATGLDHTFQTIPEGDFTWADIGDTGSTLCDPWVAQNQSLIATQNPTFVTHGGDISYANQCGAPAVHQYYVNQQVWSEDAAFQPVWGNHEYGSPNSDEGQAPPPAGTPKDSLANYKGRSFITNGQAVPNDTSKQINNPGCGWETGSTTNTCQGSDWGWFQTGHVLFISYPEPWPDAYPAWQTVANSLMASAQANPSIDFIVTYGHRPAYSSSETDVNTDLRTAIDNLALKYSPSATNPNGKYILNVNHHVHLEEVFKPIDGLVNITNGGGGAGQTSPSPLDPNSIFEMVHPGILSAQYNSEQHSLTVNLLCGPAYAPNPKTQCTYGSTLYSQTFTRPNSITPSPEVQTTLSDNNPTPQVGQQTTYTVGVGDSQSSTTTQGVTTTINLPTNTSIVNANGGTVIGNTVSWNVGTLTGGQPPLTEQVVVKLQSGATNSSLTTTATTTTSDAACQAAGSACSASDTQIIAAPSPAQYQWITNQGVDTNLAGWTGIYGPSPYVTVTQDTTTVHSGTASIRVSAQSGATNLSSGFNDNPRWVLNTVGGTVYTQSTWVKPSFVGQKISIRLREWRGATLVTDKFVILTAVSTNWQQMTQTLTAGGSGNQLSFAVYGNGLSAGQWFNADDFSLTSPN